jgi:hypothetical protein
LAILHDQEDKSDKEQSALQEADRILSALVAENPFTRAQWVDWMGLPNLNAAMGDAADRRSDSVTALKQYRMALELQRALLLLRPDDKGATKERDRLQDRVSSLERTTQPRQR